MKFQVFDLNDEYITVEADSVSEDTETIDFWDKQGNLVGMFRKEVILGFAPAIRLMPTLTCPYSVYGSCSAIGGGDDKACNGDYANMIDCAYNGAERSNK